MSKLCCYIHGIETTDGKCWRCQTRNVAELNKLNLVETKLKPEEQVEFIMMDNCPYWIAMN